MTVQKVTLRECEVSVGLDGIFRVRWFPAAWISEQNAVDVLAAVTGLGGDSNILMMVNLSGAAGFESAARAVFAKERSSRKVAMIGASPVDEVIAHYVSTLDPRLRRTWFFSSEEEAEAWLLCS
ncbi:hypothetical protein J7I84_07415 [Arthrobacter sp. ISL-85]|uniref:DUF7793 family protein n=1 Tax=Arthrobacter sp. ISL-85 TaxID=2819115 RepID=UPI001BED1FCD|nr:hypothetical protein [Arthrobacter sp. ISL-85]MBT2566322.1 hypothetical protein [Arthrobacter sp. ISL-85]